MVARGWEGQQKLLNVQCKGLHLIPLFLMMLHFRFTALTVPVVWLSPILCLSIFTTHSNMMLPGWEEKFFLRTKEKTQLSDSSYTSLRFGEIFKIIICFNYIPKMKKINGLLSLPCLALSYINYFLKRIMCCLKR